MTHKISTFSLDSTTVSLLNNFAQENHVSKSAALRLLILKGCKGGKANGK